MYLGCIPVVAKERSGGTGMGKGVGRRRRRRRSMWQDGKRKVESQRGRSMWEKLQGDGRKWKWKGGEWNERAKFFFG